VTRAQAFEHEERRGGEATDLLLSLKHAGSWHRFRCVPSGKCSCERPATTTRKAS
jgi:hypothetical protein